MEFDLEPIARIINMLRIEEHGFRVVKMRWQPTF